MLKTVMTIISSVVLSAVTVLLLLPVLQPHNDKDRTVEAPSNAVQEKLRKQQQRVREMVIEDVEKYGPDIYSMFCEISQNDSRIPGSNFSADKCYKKLQVTYPDSNIYKLASAWICNKSVVERDIIRVEKIISELPEDAPHQLMPNGFEIEPVLYLVMFNYFQHIGKLEDARRVLTVMQEKYDDSLLLLPEGNTFSVGEWCEQQRRIYSAIEKYKKKDKK